MTQPIHKALRALIRTTQEQGNLIPTDGGKMPLFNDGAQISLSVSSVDFQNDADFLRFQPSEPPAAGAAEKLRMFEVLAIREPSDWEKLAEILIGFPDAKLIEPRLGGLLGSENLTIAIERQYIDKDFRDTFSAYFSKRFHTPSSRCARLHFFRGIRDTDADPRGELPEETRYLGYTVLRPIHTGGLGRTFLSSDLILTHGEEHLHAKLCHERINLLGKDYKIEGFPYISQDTEVAVCVQASLWMIVRYFSNSYPNYREIGPHQLANLVSDFSLGRVFPSQGLEIWQASEILRRSGFHPVIHEKNAFKKDNLAEKLGFETADEAFEHLFYTYIESGIPLMVAYNDHAVVAFGHVSDYTRKYPKKAFKGCRFVHSSGWNLRFLIHDDAQLPYNSLAIEKDDTDRCFSKVKAFIAPMPEKTFLSSDEYHRLAYQLLNSKEFGTKENSPALDKAITRGEIVLRSFLTTGSNLKRSISQRDISPELVEAYLHYSLPHFVWITEIHLLAKYPQNCIGQIVWDASSSARDDATNFLFVHYPDVFFMNTAPHFNRSLGPRPKDVIDLRLQEPLSTFTTFRPFALNLSTRSPSHGSEKKDRA